MSEKQNQDEEQDQAQDEDQDPAAARLDLSPRVAELLALGDQFVNREAWPNYPERFGLTAEHVPELIRLATDRELNEGAVDEPAIWAPIHAWRALAQLGAEEAAQPLVEMLAWAQDHDYAFEELPVVFGMLGRPAFPALKRLVDDPGTERWTRMSSAEGLRRIAEAVPELRGEAVAALVGALEAFAENDPVLNASLIGELTDLQATEAAPLIERAFAANAVEVPIVGDWEDVQIGLGLLSERITPRPNYALLPELGEPILDPAPASPRGGRGTAKQREKSKRKRKLARQSRKRNRR